MDHLDYAKNLYSQTATCVRKTETHHFAMRLGQVAQAAALIALVEAQRELVAEQRKTNELLGQLIDAYRWTVIDRALENFTKHRRPAEDGDCGDEG